MNTDESRVDVAGEPGLVSVVIPTYDRAYIIGRAIESVLQQTYRSVEVIVIDDGSTDDTRRVVEAFGPPVRYFYQTNAGVSAARNHGLRKARGEFVALLDSDDLWLPWKLEAQVQLMRSFPDVGMIWTDMVAIDSAEKVLHPAYLRVMYHAHRTVCIEEACALAGRLREFWPGAPPEVSDRPFYRGNIFSEMILGNLVHTSTVLLRRTRLTQVGGFDESLIKSGEDYEFHLHTCFYGPVGFFDAASILYRKGADDQLTAPRYMLYTARNNLATVRKWLARGQGRITLPAAVIRGHLAECCAWLASEKYVAGDYWGGRADHLRSLWLRPWQPRLWGHFAYHFLPGWIRRGVRNLRRRLSSAKQPGVGPAL
ncbi:MAG: glycosyltransferase family 2 protein [Planctomycetia bacterium]|nr:glycosyltransferase family 2 protein [Planctomycetia bacterium]